MLGRTWSGRGILLTWIILILTAVSAAAVFTELWPDPCGFSFRLRNIRNGVGGMCDSSAYDAIRLGVVVVLIVLALVLALTTRDWFRAEPRLAHFGSWIQGWHPGQLVIAWVGAAVLLLALLVVLEAEGGEEGMVFSAVSAVLAMLGVTWKWFGGRPT